jgi:plastocyanin
MAMALPAAMRTLVTAILGLTLAACTVGNVGDDGTTPPGDDNPPPPGDDQPPPPPDPKVAVGIGPSTITSELGSIDNDFTITVTGSDNFSGAVTLAYTGVPADWNAALDTDTVTVPVNGTATATLNIRVPTNSTAGTATINVTATSSAAPATAPTPATLDILNQVTVHIAAGTGTDGGNHIYPVSEIRVKAGATVRIQNDDGITHRMHGDNLFPHEDDGAPTADPGGVYEVQMNDTGLGDFYCHDHGGPAVNVIVE